MSVTNGLSGRVALVTGGASGIGLATVAELARAGARVALGFHPGHTHDGEGEAATLRDAGLEVSAHPVDVSDAASVEALHAAVRSELGPPTIVVANAGVASRTPSGAHDARTWSRVLEVNLTGAYHTLALAVPAMMEAGVGRLIAVSSVSGPLLGWPEHAAYCASKAGLVGLVRALAVDLARHGITANAVAPGLVRTPQSEDEGDGLGTRRIDEVAGSIPVGRAGEPEDVAGVITFLAGSAAGYVTGQLLVIDGGSSVVEAT